MVFFEPRLQVNVLAALPFPTSIINKKIATILGRLLCASSRRLIDGKII